jgi:glycine/D-amino acid oxidase-like deaminating enzyme
VDLTSGYPFWPIRDGLLQTYPRLDEDVSVDVIVLGGGVTGALVARALAVAGIETMVLDKRDIGWGSTAASTALLQYEVDVLVTDLAKTIGARDAGRAYLACRGAIDTLGVITQELRAETGFVRKKSLYYASRKRDRKLLRAEHAMRQSLGLRVDWLDEADIAERFAFTRPAALLTYDAAQVDPYALTHALLGDAVERGARVHDRTNVSEVERRDDGVVVQTADGCTVHARHIVFATGYETHAFLEQRDVKLVSTYALVSEPMTSFEGWGEDRCLIWEHARPYLYLRTTDDDRIIVGGEDEPFRDPGRRDRLLPKKTRRLAERFRELFPDLPFEVAFSWTGTFGETDDGLPRIGRHPDWPHAWFALGYGGNGTVFAVLAAEIIRDGLLGREHPDADLFGFSR